MTAGAGIGQTRVPLRATYFLILGLLYLPVALLILFSFSGNTLLIFPIEGFPTLDNYAAVLSDDVMINAARNSFIVGALAATLATALGFGVSVATVRFRYRGRTTLLGLSPVPLIVPFIVLGVSRFSLFIFVLVANLIGLFPYFFTVTSHIIVTFALAILVVGTVVVYGFMKNGLGFLNLFVPKGVPGILVPLVVLIEVVSFLSRPISLSVRLFANMLAGHITLKVFAGFVVSLGAFGVAGAAGAVLPLAMTVAITALEILVAFLQAYVFAVLTCMYLNDAIHPGH